MQIKTFTPKDHKIKALIYGPSGAGKTYFTGTAEKTLYASAEGGLLSIKDKMPEFVEIKSLRDLREVYQFLSQSGHKYETLVIDSITEINEIIKAEIETKTGHTMQLQDWGTLSKNIRDIFRQLRDLPINLILIAQESYITDEDKIKKVVPSLNGKAATEVAYFMDIVGYINIESDGRRWIETSTNKKLLTKDRSGVIGNDAPFDFSEWVKLAQSIKTGEQEIKYTTPAPNVNQAVVTGPPAHLTSLKKELMKLGATDSASALNLINSLLGIKLKDLNLPESDASKYMVKLLQVKIPAEDVKVEEKPVKKTIKKTIKK